jgi:hypothetical protein
MYSLELILVPTRGNKFPSLVDEEYVTFNNFSKQVKLYVKLKKIKASSSFKVTVSLNSLNLIFHL